MMESVEQVCLAESAKDRGKFPRQRNMANETYVLFFATNIH